MKCSKCGSEVCFLEKYCWKCGEKNGTSVPLKAYEDDKDKFAFHAEYYGNLDKVDTRYSHYDGHIYFFNEYKNRFTKVCTENGELTVIPTDESIMDLLMHHAEIYVNSQGVFLKKENEYVLLSHDGKKRGSVDFASLLKEGETIGSTYIYDSKLYVSVSGKKDSNITIAEYDILDKNSWHELWRFTDIEAELTDMCLQQWRRYDDEGGKCKTTFDEEDYRYLKCKYVYANMENLIFKIEFEKGDGEVDVGQEFIIAYKLKLGEWESLCIGEQCSDIRFDMLHNLMWVVNEAKKIECAPIQNVYDIKEFRKNILEERTWHDGSENSWTDRFRINECYFDGEIAIYPQSYCQFYVFSQDGSCMEWNQSGHGGADLYIVLGQWIKVRLDCLFYDKGLTFLPLQQERAPESEWLVVTEEMLNADEIVKPEMKPKYCIYCGEGLMEDARFCIICGKQVWRK